jgi:hypothetical protein
VWPIKEVVEMRKGMEKLFGGEKIEKRRER